MLPSSYNHDGLVPQLAQISLTRDFGGQLHLGHPQSLCKLRTEPICQLGGGCSSGRAQAAAELPHKLC